MEKLIRNELLSEQYYEIDHASGLKIFVMEKPDYSGAYAVFGTKYGSVDTCFRIKGEESYTEVPEGIAHFLEHKLFESEELDAFERFAKTGASANAYTSFDRTCYLFQCADNWSENLEILLDFVKAPYFTEETVLKEQGIIGQEIRMYQDDPDWQVLFNLLRGLYHNNPVRIDIAGTVESISEINAELLYSCYRTFYNNSNMALAVAGNVKKDEVIAIADKVLKKEEPVYYEQIIPAESTSAVTAYTEENMGVDMPKFAIGYKTATVTENQVRDNLVTNLALDIVLGKISPLYSSLMENGLINSSFSKEYFTGRGFSCLLISGESNDPEKVLTEIKAQVKKLQCDGVPDEDFEISLKRLYGRDVYSFNETENLANGLVDSYFNGYGIFDTLDLYKSVTKDEVEKVIKEKFKDEGCCLSVIK